MWTKCLPLIACTIGCDQLAPAEQPQLDLPAAITVPAQPTPPSWRTRWMTTHPGVDIKWAGAVTLVPEGGTPLDTVRVRVELAPSERTMSVDASTARIEVTGRAPIRPIAINGDLGTLPVVTLEPGTSATLDVWFPIPKAPTAFTFAWTAMSAHGQQGLRALVELDATPADQPGTTGRWWFAPTYAWATYRHQDGVMTPQPPTNARLEATTAPDPIENPCDQW